MTPERHWAWLGLAYGLALFVFAFGSAGMGHGTYLPFGLYGAPFSAVPALGIFMAPAWWGAFGSLLGSRRRGITAVMVTLHTVSATAVLYFGTPFERGDDRWQYFWNAERIMPAWLWGGMVVYVLGLLVAWSAVTALWITASE